MAQTTFPARETPLITPNLLPLLRGVVPDGVISGLLIRRDPLDAAFPNRIRIGNGSYARDGSVTIEDAETVLDIAVPAPGGTGGTHYRVFVTYAYSDAVLQQAHVFGSVLGTYQASPALPANSILLADVLINTGDTLDSANTRIINVPKIINREQLRQIVHSNWNVFLAGGGMIAWNQGTGALTWTANILVRILGLVGPNAGIFERADGTDVGSAPYLEGAIVVADSPLALVDSAAVVSSRGFIFASLDRAANLSAGSDVPITLVFYDVTNPSTAARDALLGAGATEQTLDNVLVLAVLVNNALYFRNGWILQNNAVLEPSRIVEGALQTRYGLFYRDDAGVDHVPDADGVVRLDTATLGGALNTNRSLLQVPNFHLPANDFALTNLNLLIEIYSNTTNGQIWTIQQSAPGPVYGWASANSILVRNATTQKRRLRLSDISPIPGEVTVAAAVLSRSGTTFDAFPSFIALPNLPDIRQFIGFNVRVRGTAYRTAGIDTGTITTRIELARYTVAAPATIFAGEAENVGQNLTFLLADIAGVGQAFDINLDIVAGTTGLVLRLIPANEGGLSITGRVEFEDILVTCNSPSWNLEQIPRPFVPALEDRVVLGEHNTTLTAHLGNMAFSVDPNNPNRVETRLVSSSGAFSSRPVAGTNSSRISVTKHGDQARNIVGRTVTLFDVSGADESPSNSRGLTLRGGRLLLTDRVDTYSQGSIIVAADEDDAVGGHINLVELRIFSNADAGLVFGERFDTEIYVKGDALVAVTVEVGDIRLTPIRVFTDGELVGTYEPGSVVVGGELDIGRAYDGAPPTVPILRRIAGTNRVYIKPFGIVPDTVAINWIRICVLDHIGLVANQVVGTKVLAGDIGDIGNVATEAFVQFLPVSNRAYAAGVVAAAAVPGWVRLGATPFGEGATTFSVDFNGDVRASTSYGYTTTQTQFVTFGPDSMGPVAVPGAPNFTRHLLFGWRNNVDTAGFLRLDLKIPPLATLRTVNVFGRRFDGAGVGDGLTGAIRATTFNTVTGEATEVAIDDLGAVVFTDPDFRIPAAAGALAVPAADNQILYVHVDVNVPALDTGTIYEINAVQISYDYTVLRV